MCRNIKVLANFEPPATDDEIRASALQFVRKLSGTTRPSRANEAAFNLAVDEVTAVGNALDPFARDERGASESRRGSSEGAGAFAPAVRLALDNGPPVDRVNTTLESTIVGSVPHVPSPSQREAIEAGPRSLLVLAGPGAGKTYCLTERIRFLIEHLGFDPARICAFTFTNKAAGEIAHRLEAQPWRAPRRRSSAERSTPSAPSCCASSARTCCSSRDSASPTRSISSTRLRRIEGPRRWHRNTLTRFSAHRFRGDPLLHDDAVAVRAVRALSHDARRLLDFDTLVIKAAELLERAGRRRARAHAVGRRARRRIPGPESRAVPA